ncbi:MAG: DHHA1 domain-containing protein, partial [Candidatus Thermoplasmatota archaeon]|nr:DHHA1 domain-containing protein [Candidatus Thermoplasmatota archaeon]
MRAALKDVAKIFANGARVLVLPHSNADPDALSSALALSLCVENVDWGLPEGCNKPSKKLLSMMEIEEKSDFSLEGYDWILCVDSSLPEMMGPYSFLAEKENVAVLDHHAASAGWEKVLYHTDESKGSAAEMVYDLLKLLSLPISKKAAMLLACGIYSDTASFRYATNSALAAFLDMAVEHDFNVSDVSAMLSADMEISEKISHVKAAQRIKMLRKKDFIILGTRISAFEGSTARMMLGIGADVAFVGSQSKDNVRISCRARRKPLEAGLHLGKVMEEVVEEIGGSGGGHDGAAGLNTTGDVEAVLNICMEKT